VLDVDVKNDQPGRASLHRLIRGKLAVRPYAVTQTTTGEFHYWYPSSGDANHARLCGLDYRGIGGYVVIPPSQIGGTRYLLKVEPGANPLPVDWEACKRLLKPLPARPPPPAYQRFPGDTENMPGLSEFVAQQGEGNWNEAL
jgi:hypothetical protein